MIIHLQVRDDAGRRAGTYRVDWGDGVPPSAGETLTIGPLKVAIAEYEVKRHSPLVRGDGSINMQSLYTCLAYITPAEARVLMDWMKTLPRKYSVNGPITVPAWPGGGDE